MLLSPQAIPKRRHIPAGRGKSLERVAEAFHSGPMAELAKQIIRQQWPLRHHADPLCRAQAKTLIRTHVILLRQWQDDSVAA